MFFSFLALNAGGWLADNLIRRGFNKTRVRKIMQTVGFAHVDVHNMTGGVVALHVGIKQS